MALSFSDLRLAILVFDDRLRGERIFHSP